MTKIMLLALAFVACTVLVAYDAITGATIPTKDEEKKERNVLVIKTEDTEKEIEENENIKFANSISLSYDITILNKTKSNYRITLDGRTLGKIAPKKKQTFSVKSGGAGKLEAIQLDGYDIIPSQIQWKVPSQVPGTSVSFTIKRQ